MKPNGTAIPASEDKPETNMVPEVTREGTARLGCPTVKITGREGRPLLREESERERDGCHEKHVKAERSSRLQA
ncbi:hypothetical protein LSAT2_016141 [Lamellibrachia satsuma]|nr:hypothetical protein LSAT2_016141 [Lamellibrachia satsuma]